MNVQEDAAKQRDASFRGEKAERILESDIWQECWTIYESRLMDEFKACKSDDTSRMQQLKMLHLAGVACRSHLEAILKDGRFAARDLEFKEKRGLLRVFK